MNTVTITINNNTIFDKIVLGYTINKVTLLWGNDIKEKDKSLLENQILCFISDIQQKYKNIKVLDLSHLDGLKIVNIFETHLYEIYYPYTVENVIINNNKTLRKVSAHGAKLISIRHVPTLECIEFGSNLKELSLTETGITHINIPAHTNLINSAFKGCKNLLSVYLGKGIDVPASTFENCVSLYEVTLPDDLLVIEPLLFRGCSNLRYVFGGKNVKQLFPSAFEGCYNLKLIECKDFYRFADLDVSDKQWMKRIRPYSSVKDVKSRINLFVQNLKDNKVDNPEDYILNKFFLVKEEHFGLVMEYRHQIGWLVWSFSKNHFFATRGLYNHTICEGDLITFTIERKPNIRIEDNLYIQFPMIYINDSNFFKIISHDSESKDFKGYENILEYLKPKFSFLENYKKIIRTVKTLDISQIIDSYSIKVCTWWQSNPGRDDCKFYERIAKTDYTDEYLNILLPNEEELSYGNGSRPWGYDIQEKEKENRKIQESADAEAKRLRELAHNNYSRDAHVCKLLQTIIIKRKEFEEEIEREYHIEAIRNFLQKRSNNSLNELYNYSIDDVLNDISK